MTMRNRIKKKRKPLPQVLFLYQKVVVIGIVLSIVSILYVFQVTAQTKFPTPPSGMKQNAGEKKQLLDDSEPIHISTEFHSPLSLERPTRVIIPKVTIDMLTVPAAVIDGHWEVSEVYANHGQGTAYPGQKGNMVIFAHAREHMFLNLQNITQGDVIYILTNKKWYTYTVSEIKQVSPEQVEVIAPTDDERVTLFTCSGYLDEKRFIVIAKRQQNTDGELIRKIY